MAVSMQKALNYVKNVGSSFGYAAIDMIKEYDVADSISDNIETVRDLYRDIKDFKSSPSDKIKSNQKIMSYSNDIKSGIENLKSDIKTGQWYNKSRSDDAMSKLLGFDFDFEDFDFDFNMDEEDEKADVVATLEGTEKEILAMDIVGSKVSAAVGSATAKSAEYIVNANAESTRSLMNQNNKIFNVLSTGMVGVNKTLGEIAKLQQPLTVHMQNASTFYTKSTENQLKIISLLEKVEENTRKPASTSTSSRKNAIGIDDYFDSNGFLSIRALIDNAKKNGKEAFDNTTLGMILSMNDMMGEGTITKMFASNPIGMITTLVLPDLIITDELKKSLGKFSKALSAASNKALKDLNKYKDSFDHPVLSFISSLFGFSEGKGEKIGRPGEYEKGAVSFDGYTKQAITKVIPEYLSMILSAIDGQSQRLYNYEKGKFTNRSEIKEKVRKDFERTVSSTSYDFKTAATKNLSKNAKKRRNDISKLIDKYVGNAIKTNHLIVGPGQTIDPEKYSYYGFSNKDELADFLSIISTVEADDESWPELELLNHNIHAARIRNENSSYKQYDTEMYLYDGSEYEYTNSINSAIANLQSLNNGRGKRTKGNKAARSSDEAAAAGAAQSTARVISKWSVEQEMKDSGLEEDSAIFKKISKKAEELEKKDSLTDKDIDDFEEMLNKALNNSNNGNKVDKGFENVKGFMGKLRNFIGSPLDAAKSILDKGTETLKRLMYGKEGEEDDKSILGHIFINMKQLFTDFKDWTKETIFDPIKKKLDDEGGLAKIISKFFGIDEEKEKKLKEIKQNVKNRFKSVGKWVVDNNIFVKQYRAYKARKAGQIGGQKAGANWQAYADGDPFAEGPGESGLGSGLTKFYAKKFRGGASEQANTNNATDNRNFFENTRDEFKNAASSFIHAIFPSKKDLDKDMQKAADATESAYGELKKDPSSAITGALLGVGVSVLTGGIIGPFLGAALGGATGLTIGSEKVQRALFGDDVVDDQGKATGEKKGGLLGAKLSTFLSRDLSKVAGYGINGAVISMLPFIPGGPITGLLLGSAIGFANREGKLEQKLFGTKGENGREDDGFISKEFQEKVKKLLPKAAVGAGLGILAGPFGILGNIILGTGLGFMSETERFKSAIFGKLKDENDPDSEREGGITGWIRKDIIKPVADALVPIAVEIKNKGVDLVRWTARTIANTFSKIVAIPVKDKIMNWLDSDQTSKGFLGSIANIIGGVVSLPFKAVGGIGKGLRRKQIRKGRANDMTARARLDYRNENGLGTDEFTDFDIALANTETSDITKFLNDFRAARKSRDQEQIDSKVNEFKTKFGLQNINITDKNIDKYLDNLSSEKRQRKIEQAKLSPDEVRNKLIESHATKLENMVGAIANKILGRKVFDEKIPGAITTNENSNEEEQGKNTPGSVQTRRSTKTVVKSLFNPFTGMDMESVQEAIGYYEDKLNGNAYSSWRSQFSGRGRDISRRVRKVEVDGVLRDDVIEVTDKNGYTVVVQKVNGSWMPYKWGSQFMESLKGTTVGKIVSNTVITAKAVGNTIKTVYKMITKNPFVGMDMKVVNKALALYLKKQVSGLSDDDEAFYVGHIKELNSEYPGENVIRVNDDKGHSTVVRWDEKRNDWVYVGAIWRAKYKFNQGAAKVRSAIVKAGSKIKNFASNIVQNIRHINPFCDFEPEEAKEVINILNSVEFDGGSTVKGKVELVSGLKHYYDVYSEKNGVKVTVTPENGKWVYVSPERLQAAKARNLVAGLGGMVNNIARGFINKIGNRNNAFGSNNPEDTVINEGQAEGAGSKLNKKYRKLRGGGGFSEFITSGLKAIGEKILSSGDDEDGGGLFGSSNNENKSQLDSKDIGGVNLRSALDRINKSKFNPVNFLRMNKENAGKDMNSKEAREAERERQSTLNIFRQSNHTEQQISDKLDILINGLFGSGNEKSGGVFGSGGLFSSLLGGIGSAALGIGGLMALRSGMLDKPLEGIGGSVNGDNTGTNNEKDTFSNVAAITSSGETINLGTKNGKIITDENGNYLTTTGKAINPDDVTVNYRGTSGYGNRMPYYAFKGFLKHGSTPFSPLRRLGINGIGAIGERIPFVKNFINRTATANANKAIDAFGIRARDRVLSAIGNAPGIRNITNAVEGTKFGNFLENMWQRKTAKELGESTVSKVTREAAEDMSSKAIRETAEELLPKSAGFAAFREKYGNDAKKMWNMATKGTKEATEDMSSKAVKEAAENATGKAVKELAEEGAQKAAKETLFNTFKEAFQSFFKKLSTSKLARKVLGNNVEAFGDQFIGKVIKETSEKIYEKAGINAAQQAVGAIPIAGWIVAVVFAVIEFEEAWNRAGRIFKVKEPTIVEKFISGLTAAVQEIIGDLFHFPIDFVPTEFLIKGTIWVLEKCGVPFKDLNKRREEAQKELDEFNATVRKGKEAYTFEEWATAEEGLNQRTIGEKAIGGIKSFWANASSNFKNAGTGIKNAWNSGVKGARDLSFVTKDILNFVKSGDISGLLSYDPSKNENISGEESLAVKAMAIYGKLNNIIPTSFSWVGHRIKDGTVGIVNKVQNTISMAQSEFEKGNQLLNDPNSKLTDFLDFGNLDNDPENPMGKLTKGILIGSRLSTIPIGLLKAAGKSVSKKFDEIKATFNNSQRNLAIGRTAMSNLASQGNTSAIWDYDITNDAENVGAITKAELWFDKLGYAFKSGLINTGKNINEIFNSIKATYANSQRNLAIGRTAMNNLASAGNTSAIWDYDITNDAENVGAITKAELWFDKLGYAFKSGLINTGKNISDIFNKIKITYTNSQRNLAIGRTAMNNLASAGNTSAIWDYDITNDAENVGGITKAELWFDKLGYVFKSGLINTGKNISAILDPLKAKFNDISNLFNTNSEALSSYAGKGDFKSILNYNPAGANGEGIGAIGKFVTFLQKIIYGVQAGLTKLGNLMGTIKDKVGGVWDDITSSIHEKVLNKAESIYQKAKNTITGKTEESGGASFISQVDPSVAGKQFGGTTIGDNGCAPSVASMITGMPLSSTANYAANKGYVNNRGTSADYFGSVLDYAGIPNEYVYTGGNSATDYLASRIAGGSPTVLLGQDPYNTSKENSPFGPGNHYVLATGMTNDGGVVIQDPESRTPNQIYDSSILNSVKLGIPTGSGSGIIRRTIRRFVGGASRDVSYEAQIKAKNQAASIESNKGDIKNKGYSSSIDGYKQFNNNISKNTKEIVPWNEENALHENLGIWSKISAAELNAWISQHCKKPDSPYIGNADVIIEAANISGLDPRYILAHSICESAWGTSNICKQKANYYGIGAFDATPFASSYSFGANGVPQWGTREHFRTGIIEGAKWISKNYYHGAKGTNSHPQCSVWAMQHGRPGHRYATSQTWEFTLSKDMASMPANTLCTLSESPTGTSPDAFSTSGASVASASFGSNEGATGESNSSSNVTGGFIDKFKQLIFAKFGKIAELVGINKGDESESNGENGSYGTGENGVGSTGGTGYAGTGDWRNVIDVDPGEPNEKQIALVDKMKSIAGTLKYSMSGPRNPDAGSADCSSTVNWAYNKILGADVGGTTPAIMQSSNLSTVDMSDLPETGGTGSGPDLKKLQLGDLVLLSRPTSGFTSGRPFRVGHVEMYMGDGKTIGHGSNGGPRERQIESDKYIMARRFNDFIPLDAVYAKKNENSIRNRGYSSSMDGYNSNTSSKSNTVDTSGSLKDRGYSSSMEDYSSSSTNAIKSAVDISSKPANKTITSEKELIEYNKSQGAIGGASGLNPKQNALVNKMKSVQGKLEYSMEGPRDPDAGSADCSSTVNWAYKNILGIDIGSNTEGILKSNSLYTVDQSNLPYEGGIGNGPNLNKLQPGDLILTTRNGNYTKGRPYRVGHVEMYIGDGQTIGHGGPMPGPTIKPIEHEKYIMARRATNLVNDASLRNKGYSNSMEAINTTNTPIAASGSGLTYNIAQDGINTIRRSHKSSKSAFGGASGIYNLSKFSKYRKSKYYKDLRGGASLTGDQNDKEILIAMVKGIITLLSNVSANSDKIGDIVTAIGDINSSNSQNFKTSVNAVKNDLGVSDTDETIAQMQQLLNNLAAG